jgi:hypothetical protein
MVDPSVSSVVAHISLEDVRRDIKKASLLPPVDWRSLQAVTHDQVSPVAEISVPVYEIAHCRDCQSQRCLLFASGTLPDDVVTAWSDPSTTCALLEYKPAAETLDCKGIFSLGGVGPAAIATIDGEMSSLRACSGLISQEAAFNRSSDHTSDWHWFQSLRHPL